MTACRSVTPNVRRCPNSRHLIRSGTFNQPEPLPNVGLAAQFQEKGNRPKPTPWQKESPRTLIHSRG